MPVGMRAQYVDSEPPQRDAPSPSPPSRLPVNPIKRCDLFLHTKPSSTLENKNMNWEQISGKWHQAAGQVKSQWAKLTDDDLANVAGKKEQLVGKVQERYGVIKEDAEKQVDEWIAKFAPTPDK
jgi:uncharacterized protein YjbJ (UPF0337 family)